MPSIRSRKLPKLLALPSALLCACAPFAAGAVQTFNEDLEIANTDPALIFNDTSTAADGFEYVIRGRDEFFSIRDDIANRTHLYVNNSVRSITLGENASAAGTFSAAVGKDASASGSSSIALGFDASTDGSSSIALGHVSEAPGNWAVAIGYLTNAEANFSTAIGYLAEATQPNTVILGDSGSDGVSPRPAADIGIGTSTPTQAVDVQRSSAAARFQLTSFTDTASEAPQYIQRRARGKSSGPMAVQANDNLGLFSFRGYNGSVMGGSRATITAQAAGNFTNSSTPTRLIFAVAPTGATAPEQVLVIENGQVKINGQNLNVPDYVFEDDYQLMPLEELRAFIDENGHLPGIAPATHVNENGLDLAGSHLGLLQKVEELTLYALQQQSRIDRLEAQLAQVLDAPE